MVLTLALRRMFVRHLMAPSALESLMRPRTYINFALLGSHPSKIARLRQCLICFVRQACRLFFGYWETLQHDPSEAFDSGELHHLLNVGCQCAQLGKNQTSIDL